jgi:acetyl esterase/lipase
MVNRLFLIFIIISGLPGSLFSQYPELDYLKSLHPEKEVRRILKISYSNDLILPVPEETFNYLRSKRVGESFIDPNFGRRWTLIFDGGLNIMNSERNHWNSDTTIFFLEAGTGPGYKTLALFNGKTLEYIRSVTVSDLPSWKGGNTRTAFRWVPGKPDLLFYVVGNKMFTYNILNNEKLVFQEFASFTLTEHDLAGGDGNDVSPNGDMLFGNKGNSCFVFNIKDKKIVRISNGSREYCDAGKPFPVFSLGNIDYAVSFGGYIFSLEGGIILKDLSGNIIQSLYRRTPHMDPSYFKKDSTLYCGVMVRYNDADAKYYEGLGYPSKAGKAYFHGFNPQNPRLLVRFDMDDWPSTILGSGGQHSCNRCDGSTGLICTNGPELHRLAWEPRFGECYEQAYFADESLNTRRFAHHYIGYSSIHTSSEQPEGWISPDGEFAVVKTKWGWYKVELKQRMPKIAVENYLSNPAGMKDTGLSGSGPDFNKPLEKEGASRYLFKKTGETNLYLYVFEPDGHTKSNKTAAIVFFHGGGWKGGISTQFDEQCRYLASRGMVAIEADYRLTTMDNITPFECVTDGKSAIRWVRMHANELGIDPDRIAAGGGSAGGHIAAACGTVIGLESEDENVKISSKPDALILFNPVFDNGPNGYGYEYFKERYQEISPLHNIRPGVPPAIIFLGTNDSNIPVATAEDFAFRMKKDGNRCDLRLYEGQEHGFFNANKGGFKMYSETLLETENFLMSLGYIEGPPIVIPGKTEKKH